MRKPRYVVVPCSYCRGPHYLVKRNILTSRPIAASAAYTTQAAAQTDADRRNARRT